jgi:hypothetical protein
MSRPASRTAFGLRLNYVLQMTETRFRDAVAATKDFAGIVVVVGLGSRTREASQAGRRAIISISILAS